MMKQILILALFLVAAHESFAGSEPAHTDYEPVGPSATAQVLGPVGGAGDVLERLVVHVTTSGATGTVAVLDGSNAMAVVPASTPVGVYSVLIGARSSSGAWKVTTGAGASTIAIGRFK